MDEPGRLVFGDVAAWLALGEHELANRLDEKVGPFVRVHDGAVHLEQLLGLIRGNRTAGPDFRAKVAQLLCANWRAVGKGAGLRRWIEGHAIPRESGGARVNRGA